MMTLIDEPGVSVRPSIKFSSHEFVPTCETKKPTTGELEPLFSLKFRSSSANAAVGAIRSAAPAPIRSFMTCPFPNCVLERNGAGQRWDTAALD
jgi:hypothetical protein